ncbi:Disease resistance protein RPM1 [Dichanthelium oligosanthes]|uniref:Disease resistance protein RPM1 n=1 Tax=Dichanthelium oligosanthes TaxID=888268 RepID=A0A1E5VER7_9POAL|nr:Disease resistance protein RPM1 [Dichanthelium oligosanthes]
MQIFLHEMEACSGDRAVATEAWVHQMRDIVLDSEDVFDVCEASQVRGCSILGNLRAWGKVGARIRRIRNQLSNVSRRRLEYPPVPPANSSDDWIRGLLASSPLVHDKDTVGMDIDQDTLLHHILDGESELSVMSLVGMGGVGKTTLAKKVYNHPDVKRHFDRSSWVYVSNMMELRGVLREMAKGLMRIPSAEASSLSEGQLQELLLSGLGGIRFLLVLDDVWDRGLWDVIKLVLPKNDSGSRVLVTTRNIVVAESVVDVRSDVHRLQPMTFQDSYNLFCKKAFLKDGICPDDLKEMAEDIVRKCAGLPLAIVAAGSMMSRKEKTDTRWKSVLESIQKDLNNGDTGVQQALLLSYKDLPHPLKPCFLLLSVIPYDSEVSRKKLVRLWIAEGFVKEKNNETLETTAEKYLMELINRSMIEVAVASSSGRVKACRVHDLLHDLAISLSENGNFSVICHDKCASTSSRRISLQTSHFSFCKEHKKRLRSVFMFSSSSPCILKSNIVAKSFELVRILDLEDGNVLKLPKEIGGLLHLRYLGLRGTKLKKLPRTLQKLYHLQTLDIRKTQINKIVFQIKCLRNLRNLEMRKDGQSISVPMGLAQLDKLQVITGLQASAAVVHEIASLTQLQKLSIEDLSNEDTEKLCTSVNNLKELSYLSIFASDGIRPLDVATLKPSSCLQKLHLAGSLQTLPDWFGQLHSLTKLRLSFSKLKEDPLSVLAQLPNLLFLQLNKAYEGKVMRSCCPGFPKLKIFIITELEELEEWDVDEGSMPCVLEMWIMLCENLVTVPTGLQSLATLQRLRLVGMPNSFIGRLGELVTRIATCSLSDKPVLLSAWRVIFDAANAEVEALACKGGVMLAMEWVRKPAILESDCVAVVQYIKEASKVRPACFFTIQEARSSAESLPSLL